MTKSFDCSKYQTTWQFIICESILFIERAWLGKCMTVGIRRLHEKAIFSPPLSVSLCYRFNIKRPGK